jgi:ADP-ribose pyrophosphatase
MSSTEKIIARGKLFELVQLPQPDGRTFEVARRAPGVRVIIANHSDNTLLLTREFRRELNDWDFRLPGGKVFDTLDEFEAFRASGKDILPPAKSKAKGESAEEAGIDVKAVQLVKISTLGATVEWDLYIFEATAWAPHQAGQKLEVGEQIESGTWVSFAEAEAKILSGQMQEDRVALVLLQWLHKRAGENIAKT